MNNIKLVLILLLVTCITFSCKQKKIDNHNSNDEKKTEVETKKQYPNKYSKTFNAENYSITFESDNAELSTLKISTKGLETEENDSVEIEGKVIGSYMTDLNQDGFKEFFITVSPTDDSGNIDILGFASNKGKSISDIAINEPTALKDVHTDKLNIDTKSIVREFKSNGKNTTYNYYLTEGEAGYILTAKKE